MCQLTPTTSSPTYEVILPTSNVSSPMLICISSLTSKILCEIDLKCIYKLPKEDNVTFDPSQLEMFVSLSPLSLSLSPYHFDMLVEAE